MLDLNRGVTIRMHPQGFRIGMYKDDPGVYYDGSGEQISEGLAAQAGFDVNRLAKDRLKKERLAEARAKIERDFAAEEERIADQINREIEGAAYEVRHTGAGRYHIFDAAGKKATKKGMTREEAEAMLKGMTNVALPETAGEPNEGEE